MKNLKRMKHINLTLLVLLISFNSIAQIGVITGGASVCVGSTTTLADTSTGGTWSSSNPAIATVGSSTGIITGVSAGTATITYTVGLGFVTAPMVVNALPAVYTVIGGGGYCAGGTGAHIQLNNSDIGVSYQLYNGISAVGAPMAGTGTPLDFGLYTATGTYTVVATDATTLCLSNMSGSAIVSVNPLPTAFTVTGGGPYCAGGTGVVVGLMGSTTGVSYQLYTGGVPVGGSIMGTGSAISFGMQTIGGTYTVTGTNTATGCINNMSGSAVIVVNPIPAPITGSTIICVGPGGSLADATPGGTWSSSNPAVVTITLSTGALTGVTPGTTVITYTAPTACYVTTTVTVRTTPCAISGATSVCTGATTPLTNCAPGGTWTSSNLAVATIGSTSGNVGGVSAGIATITYTLTTGCYVTQSINVNTTPAPISGPSGVCDGMTPTYTDATPGGTWSSSNTGVATIGSGTGVLTLVYPGVTTLTYSIGSCSASKTATMNAVPRIYPLSSTGTAYCTGGTGIDIHLDSSDAGIHYQLYNGSLPMGSALAGTGLALDFGYQTTPGSYTVTGFNPISGCSSSTYSVTITSVPPPTGYTVTGGGGYCAGDTGRHVYISGSQTSVTYQLMLSGAAVGSPVTGTGSALDFGLHTVIGTYTVIADNGTCSVSMPGNATIAMYPLPTTYTVTGGGGYCSGGSGVSIGLTNSQAGTSYTLYDGTSPVTTATGTGSSFSFGMFTTPGIYTVIATNPATTCSNTMAGSAIVTINSLPAIYTVNGGGNYCAGGAGVHVGLLNSDAGVNYQLYRGLTAVSLLGGTGAALDYGLQTTAGSYTVVAVNATTGCSNTMSSSATVGILPTVTPAVTITASPNDTVCAGTSVTFTAIPVNGGTTPMYQWSLNGIAVAGATNSSWTTVPVDGDSISVNMTSTAACPSPATVRTSITMVVHPAPTITGSSSICLGASETLTGMTGSTWSSSNPGVATIATVGSTTGVVTSFSAGTTIITCTLSGCNTTMTLTVNSLPAISVSSTANCGGTSTLTATGGTSYSWYPTTGLSCPTCATTDAHPSTTIVYTVTGTVATGCSDTATHVFDGNKISGYISLGGGSSDTLKVWLIQFNTSDSSIAAEDSILTCIAGTTPYFEFNDKPAGSYMVKAKLLGQTPGTSGYIPTYSLSTPYWYAAASVAHATATDTMHINMVYGTVPPGPGFISGYVASGAGKGTTGFIPKQGMLVYLKDAISNFVLTYTYTDAAGKYSFSNVDYGNYVVYPEDYAYHTTPSPVIMLSSTSDSATGVDFKEYTVSMVIVPVTATGVKAIAVNHDISVYPNPASNILNIRWNNNVTEDATVVITDVVGRDVYRSVINVNAQQQETQINTSSLKTGTYLLTIKSGSTYYSGKLMIAR